MMKTHTLAQGEPDFTWPYISDQRVTLTICTFQTTSSNRLESPAELLFPFHAVRSISWASAPGRQPNGRTTLARCCRQAREGHDWSPWDDVKLDPVHRRADHSNSPGSVRDAVSCDAASLAVHATLARHCGAYCHPATRCERHRSCYTWPPRRRRCNRQPHPALPSHRPGATANLPS